MSRKPANVESTSINHMCVIKLLTFLGASSSQSMQIDAAIEPQDIPEEVSIEDQQPNTATPVTDTEEPEFCIMAKASRCGKDLLLHRGYTFNVMKRHKETTYWQCAVRNRKVICCATVKQSDGVFRVTNANHNHPAVIGHKENLQIKAKVREEANANVFVSAGVIATTAISTCMSERPNDDRPALENLIRMANRVRQKKRPSNPTDLNFELDMAHIPDNFFRADVTVGGRRHLIFSTSKQLQLLEKAKTWFMDATFHVVSSPFSQLFSIHAFVKANGVVKQVPLVFVIMSGKRKRDYGKVLKAVLCRLSTTAVKEVVINYESALWRVLQKSIQE